MNNKTKKNNIRKNKTQKNNKRNNVIGKISNRFSEILNTFKLYNWNTKSYSVHNATDSLYDELNKSIKNFVEVLIGKDCKRIRMVEKEIKVIDNKELKNCIYDFREFLTNMTNVFSKEKDTDILTICENILTHINRILYLSTFNK